MSEQLLKQIINELQSIKSEQQNTNLRLDQFESRLDQIELRLDRIETDVAEIKQSVHRIEFGQPEDIKAMLQTIYDKLDERDSEIQVLNRRVFKVESAVERLSGQ